MTPGQCLDVGESEPRFRPGRAVAEIGGDDETTDEVEELGSAGAWTYVKGGWAMEHGPSNHF